MEQRMWHCKSCGHTQSVSNSICEECGKDLGLYGEIVTSAASEYIPTSAASEYIPAPAPEVTATPPPAQPAPPAKKDGKRLVVPLIAAVAVLVVCVVLGALFLPMRLTGVALNPVGLEAQPNGRYLLRVGEKITCQVEVLHSGLLGSLPQADVTSSDTKVLRVSGSGDEVTLTAVAPGRITLTAVAGEESTTLRFEVEEDTAGNPDENPDDTPDDPPVQTAFDIYIPSFYAFLADSFPNLEEMEGSEPLGVANTYGFEYRGISEAVVQPAVEEYIQLLTGQYGLRSAGSYTYTYEGYACTDYWFTWSGGGADTFAALALDGTALGQCSVQVTSVPGMESVGITLCRADAGAVYFQDYGERTTTRPSLTITDVALECYELMYDTEQPGLRWVPEGYVMGFDIIAYYEGEGPVDFTKVSVTSSDPSVLYVDQSTFTITALSAGTATITAQGYGFSSSQEVTVYPVDRSTGCALSVDTQSLLVGSENSTIPITIRTNFTDAVSTLRVNMLTVPGIVRESADSWEDEGGRVYSRVFHIGVTPAEVEEKCANLAIFYLLRVTDDEYDISRDILDFVVIQRG